MHLAKYIRQLSHGGSQKSSYRSVMVVIRACPTVIYWRPIITREAWCNGAVWLTWRWGRTDRKWRANLPFWLVSLYVCIAWHFEGSRGIEIWWLGSQYDAIQNVTPGTGCPSELSVGTNYMLRGQDIYAKNSYCLSIWNVKDGKYIKWSSVFMMLGDQPHVGPRQILNPYAAGG